MLVEPLDPCDDPTVIRDEVKRYGLEIVLNQVLVSPILAQDVLFLAFLRCPLSGISIKIYRLNREVVQGFVKLVQELVHRPSENK